MSYITNADIESRLGTAAYIALTDDAGTGVADTARVNEARSGAEGEADSYLATRYQVPVNVAAESDAAAVLKSFVLDLAAYRLHNRRTACPGGRRAATERGGGVVLAGGKRSGSSADGVAARDEHRAGDRQADGGTGTDDDSGDAERPVMAQEPCEETSSCHDWAISKT